MDSQTPESSRYNATCPICGGPLGKNRRQKYCSSKCRIEAWRARTFQTFVSADGKTVIQMRRIGK